VVDIDEESQYLGKQIVASRGGFVLMSCQYRGENFVAICKQQDVGETKLEVTPLALILPNEKLDFITDTMGESPIIRKEEDNG